MSIFEHIKCSICSIREERQRWDKSEVEQKKNGCIYGLLDVGSLFFFFGFMLYSLLGVSAPSPNGRKAQRVQISLSPLVISGCYMPRRPSTWWAAWPWLDRPVLGFPSASRHMFAPNPSVGCFLEDIFTQNLVFWVGMSIRGQRSEFYRGLERHFRVARRRWGKTKVRVRFYESLVASSSS